MSKDPVGSRQAARNFFFVSPDGCCINLDPLVTSSVFWINLRQSGPKAQCLRHFSYVRHFSILSRSRRDAAVGPTLGKRVGSTTSRHHCKGSFFCKGFMGRENEISIHGWHAMCLEDFIQDEPK